MIAIAIGGIKILAIIVSGFAEGAVVFFASIGDATLGAIIAGIFLLINTCLTLWLTLRFTNRRYEEEHEHEEDDDDER